MTDDITFCLAECNKKECYRHPSNIQDKTIPHSYADFKGSGNCEMKDDLISRQDAIDAIKRKERHDIEHDFEFNEGLISAMNAVGYLPSAQPKIKCIAKVTMTDEQVAEAVKKATCEILAAEPKKGKWIHPFTTTAMIRECSICGKRTAGGTIAYEFCPNCGARMVEQDDNRTSD